MSPSPPLNTCSNNLWYYNRSRLSKSSDTSRTCLGKDNNDHVLHTIIHAINFSSSSLQCYPRSTIAAGAEWLSLLLISLYFLTFHPDFRRIHADLYIRLRRHHSDVERSIFDESTPLTL